MKETTQKSEPSLLKTGPGKEIITQIIYLTCAAEKEQFLPSAHDHRAILREVCYSSHAVLLFLLAPGRQEVVWGRERLLCLGWKCQRCGWAGRGDTAATQAPGPAPTQPGRHPALAHGADQTPFSSTNTRKKKIN